jgi:predicted TIM-barrel fold metal-dependent hydrolase
MIVDMRLRPPLPTWVSKPQFNEAVSYYPTRVGFPRPPSVAARSMDLLLKEMDEAEITWGVVMGRQAAEPFGSIPNDEIATALREHPKRFVGFIGIDVSQPPERSIAEIQRCIAIPGFKGVSVEPAASKTPMNLGDKRLYPIFEECRRLRIPVSVGSSNGMLPGQGAVYDHNCPVHLFQPAKDFPDLNIIVSHGGWPWVRELLGIAFSFPNVYVSPDLYLNSPSLPGANEYVMAANMYMGDRLLFGSAYPSRPLKESVEAFNYWSFSDGLKEKVLGRNALKVMNME